jgi:hypothetical protein
MTKLESHYTATGFVINKAGDRVLFIFHKKLHFGLPPGGHIDEAELPHEAVVREVFEETGVRAEIVDPIGDLKVGFDGTEIQIPTPEAAHWFTLDEILKCKTTKGSKVIGQGENDVRVSRKESEQIVAAMKAKGLPYEYAFFPDEGHGLAKPENRLKFYAIAEKFLAKYLGGRYEQ